MGEDVREVLLKTAEVIEEVGWGKGADSMYNACDKGVCVEGAMYAALRGHVAEDIDEADMAYSIVARSPAYVALCEYLGRRPMPTTLYLWNDVDAEDEYVVIEALRGAADAQVQA